MLTRTRVIITCAAAAAAAGLAASIAAPALATARPGSSIVPGPGGALRLSNNDHAAGMITATPTSTRTFAGYQTTVATGSATTVETSFAVPALSCTTADQAIAPNAGVSVNNYKTFSAAFVFVGCVNGAAVYYPGVVVNGTETDYTTSPFAAGDVIELITKVSHFRTRVQVTDMTTGVIQQITTGPGASANSAYIGDEGWGNSAGHLEHVPNFGKLQFKNCLIDGKAIGTWHPQAYQRVNSSGVVQISTGALWSTEPAFATRYLHS